jgi:hypothetical protein
MGCMDSCAQDLRNTLIQIECSDWARTMQMKLNGSEVGAWCVKNKKGGAVSTEGYGLFGCPAR